MSDAKHQLEWCKVRHPWTLRLWKCLLWSGDSYSILLNISEWDLQHSHVVYVDPALLLSTDQY